MVTVLSFLEFTTDQESTEVDGAGSCVGGGFDSLTALLYTYTMAITSSVAKTTRATGEET